MKALVIRSNMKFESHFYLAQVILVSVLKLINHNTKLWFYIIRCSSAASIRVSCWVSNKSSKCKE